jgi:hypothetical protein
MREVADAAQRGHVDGRDEVDQFGDLPVGGRVKLPGPFGH